MFFSEKKKSKTKISEPDRRVDYVLHERAVKLTFVFEVSAKKTTFTRFVLDSHRLNRFSGRLTTLIISLRHFKRICFNSNLKALLTEFKHLETLLFNLPTSDPKFYSHVLQAVKERAQQHSNLVSLKLGDIYHGETQVVFFTAEISQFVLNTQAFSSPSNLERFAAPYFFRVCERYGNKFGMGSAYSIFHHESRAYFNTLLEEGTIVEYLM